MILIHYMNNYQIIVIVAFFSLYNYANRTFIQTVLFMKSQKCTYVKTLCKTIESCVVIRQYAEIYFLYIFERMKKI